MTNITKKNFQPIIQGLGYKVTPEFKFCDYRKFRADWLVEKNGKCTLVEYEGVDPKSGFWIFHKGKRMFVYPSNGHTSAISYTKDCEKYNLACKLGYKLLRYTVMNFNDCINDLEEILK